MYSENVCGFGETEKDVVSDVEDTQMPSKPASSIFSARILLAPRKCRFAYGCFVVLLVLSVVSLLPATKRRRPNSIWVQRPIPCSHIPGAVGSL